MVIRRLARSGSNNLHTNGVNIGNGADAVKKISRESPDQRNHVSIISEHRRSA
jgi:hypothetical protein